MNAKAYLMQIKQADIRINNKVAEKQALYAMATKVTPTLSSDKAGGVGSGYVTDKIGNIVAKIAYIETEINMMIDDYVNLKNRIIHEIELLEDTRYYNLIHKRYVQYKDFSVIAEEMNYNYQSIIQMHGKALKAFEKIIKENAKRI